MCEQCQLGQMTKSRFSRKTHTSNDILELIYTDLCGPTREFYYGDRYFILFFYDYSRMIIVMFMKLKSYTFDIFKWNKTRVENEIGKQLKFLGSDRGGEYLSNKLNNFCVENGIKIYFPTPTTPQQNGVVERRNKSIFNYARTLMMEKYVGETIWREVVSNIIYTLN